MATKATTGKGTVLSIVGAGSPPANTPILAMKTISFSGQQIDFDDVTNLSSATSGNILVKENIPALRDPGTVTLSGIWIPSDPGYQAIETAYGATTLLNFSIQLPIAGTQTTTGNLGTFSGWVMSEPIPEADYSKAIPVKIEVKMNTVITWTAGS